MFGGQMMEENPGFLEKYEAGRRVSKPERASGCFGMHTMDPQKACSRLVSSLAS
jgi:hypothetical protein